MKHPSVEIIILNMNGGNHLPGCLSSLKKCTYPNFTVTLVDQCSTDGSPEMVEHTFPWVQVIRNKINNGFVGGNNQVLKKSKAKYCVLLNDDTEVDPAWLDELVNIAEQDASIAALQPKVVSLRDKSLLEYAGAAGGHMDVYGYPLCRGRVFFDVEKDQNQYGLEEIFWSCGVAMFIRREVLEEIGYFDDTYFIYFEEVDLSWRMNLAGYKQVYVPTSKIFHLGSATMGDLKNNYTFKKIFLLHRNAWLTLLKNYSLKSWLRTVPVRILLEGIAFARFLPAQPLRSSAILAANFWVVLHPQVIARGRRNVKKVRRVSDSYLRGRMIAKSIVVGYFLQNKKRFSDYKRFIKDYDSFSWKRKNL